MKYLDVCRKLLTPAQSGANVEHVATILLRRSGALDLLALLEEAADFASGTRAFDLVMQLQDGIALLIDKLFPDLPEADPA